MMDARLNDKEWRERVGFDNFYHCDWTTPTIECFANYRAYESALLTLAEIRL